MDAKTVLANKIIGQTPPNAVAAIVDYNPRGTFDFIQRTFGYPMDSWLEGFEKSDGNRQVMKDYLLAEMAKWPNKLQFVMNMMQGIPDVDPTK